MWFMAKIFLLDDPFFMPLPWPNSEGSKCTLRKEGAYD